MKNRLYLVVFCVLIAVNISCAATRPTKAQVRAILKAVEVGNIAKVRALIQSTPSLVYAKDDYGTTPLHIAAINGKTDIAVFLIDNGANINARQTDGSPPWGIEEGDCCCSTEDYVQDTYNGCTPLHWAAFHNSKKVAELLLSKGALVNPGDKHGSTPLTYAAHNGWATIAGMLIAKGANVNVVGWHKNRPLHEAVSEKHPQTTELLLTNGALVNVKGEFGTTPLDSAIYNKDIAIVKLLVAHGADVNLRDNEGSRRLSRRLNEYISTPFTFAVENEQVEMINYLLEYGGDPNAICDTVGDTVLHLASFRGQASTIKLLLEKGAKVEERNSFGNTPIMSAAVKGHIEIVKLLVLHGANVNAKNKKGTSALSFALSGNRYDTADYLRSVGAEE
ncbi:MAG: ankyrin repeat domain-containing protein [bacterium]